MERVLLATVLGTLSFYIFGSKRLGYARHKGLWRVNVTILVCVFALSFPLPETTYYDILRLSKDTRPYILRDFAKSAMATLAKKGIEDPADPMFSTLKRMEETFTSREKQRRYDSYGDFFVSGDDSHPESTLFRMITLASLNAVFTFVVGYILTTPKPLRHARSIIAMTVLIILVAEINIRLNGSARFGLLPFQLVKAVRSTFAVAVVSSAMLSDWLHDDSEEILKHQLRGLFQLQHLIVAQAEQITSLRVAR